MRRLLICAALLAASAANAAPAPTGNDYLEMVRANPTAAAWYVQGFADAALMTAGLGKKAGATGDEFKRLTICTPNGATHDQAVDIITKFILDNPDVRDRPLYTLAGTALLMVWSCGQ